MNKLLILTGPTATGKTALAIKLAKKFDGEIISADSRQVYKYMDIGTGKDREDYENASIKVWGIDLVEPDYNFNVSDYLDYTRAKTRQIWHAQKLPIIVGGTVLYIKSMLNPPETINVPPNKSLRNELIHSSVEELQMKLQELAPNKWQRMNESDKKNPRRLIRAIEVAMGPSPSYPSYPSYTPLVISLTAPLDYLYKRIDARVDQRVEQGIIQEIQNLLDKGYSWDLPSFSASGYKEFKEYILSPSPLTLDPFVQRWKFNEHAYARRQMTFLRKFVEEERKKGRKVESIDITKAGFKESVTDLVDRWYSNTDVRQKTQIRHR